MAFATPKSQLPTTLTQAHYDLEPGVIYTVRVVAAAAAAAVNSVNVAYRPRRQANSRVTQLSCGDTWKVYGDDVAWLALDASNTDPTLFVVQIDDGWELVVTRSPVSVAPASGSTLLAAPFDGWVQALVNPTNAGEIQVNGRPITGFTAEAAHFIVVRFPVQRGAIPVITDSTGVAVVVTWAVVTTA